MSFLALMEDTIASAVSRRCMCEKTLDDNRQPDRLCVGGEGGSSSLALLACVSRLSAGLPSHDPFCGPGSPVCR